jgi:hypothetical protein
MTESAVTNGRLRAMIAIAAAGVLLLSVGICRSVQVRNLPEKDFAKKPDEYKPVLALSEPTMMLDVTVGGLMRLDSGEVQRTYGGDVPAAGLCPT